MSASTNIDSLTFNDGSHLSLSPNDIVVFVGPNNSGKSETLRDIRELFRDPRQPRIVAKEMTFKTEGTPDELIAWMDQSFKKLLHNPADPVYDCMGIQVSQNQARSWWQNREVGLQSLSHFFCYHLTTEARLTSANPAQNIALTRDPHTHPIHYMQANDSIERKISDFFKQAFGEDLVVHRNAGNQVPLHCGNRPIPKEGQDRVSIEYIKELEKLPTLHTQGDGMRSFVGVLLHSLVVSYPIVMIDEPEAFLHPPQARQVGRMLAKETPLNKQLFFATHSGDFLRGLLDASLPRVRVVRITRDGNINRIRELNNAGIQQLWNDPLLRYSNILDGLFHEKVVICESDADCRFYGAIMDAICEGNDNIRRPHSMFIHCGGKDRFPNVIKALRELDVPIIAINDFDVLSEENPLRGIFEALGGEWQNVQDDWKAIKAAVDSKKPELSTEEVITEIQDVLKTIKDQYFPKTGKESIQKILRRSNPWATAKSVGKGFIPSGDPSARFLSLSKAVHDKGLSIVEVGELEGFAKTIGGHGPSWVNAVLTRDLLNDTELQQARDFIKSVLQLQEMAKPTGT